jgi:hypothetical protein
MRNHDDGSCHMPCCSGAEVCVDATKLALTGVVIQRLKNMLYVQESAEIYVRTGGLHSCL